MELDEEYKDIWEQAERPSYFGYQTRMHLSFDFKKHGDNSFSRLLQKFYCNYIHEKSHPTSWPRSKVYRAMLMRSRGDSYAKISRAINRSGGVVSDTLNHLGYRFSKFRHELTLIKEIASQQIPH